jgi:hypothetical protein
MSTERIQVIVKKNELSSGTYTKRFANLKQILAMPFLQIKSISRTLGVCSATIENTTIARTGLVVGFKTYICQCKSNATFNINGDTPVLITSIQQSGNDVIFQYSQPIYSDVSYDGSIDNFTNADDIGICAFGGVVRGSGGTSFSLNEASTSIDRDIISHTVAGNVGTITLDGDHTQIFIAGQKIYTSGDAVAGFNSTTSQNPNGYFTVNSSSYSSPNTTIIYTSPSSSLTGSSGTRKLKTTLETKDVLGINIKTIYDFNFGEYMPSYDFIDSISGRNTLAFARVFGNIDMDRGSIAPYPETESISIDDKFVISLERKQDVDLIIILDFVN